MSYKRILIQWANSTRILCSGSLLSGGFYPGFVQTAQGIDIETCGLIVVVFLLMCHHNGMGQSYDNMAKL